LHAISPAWSPDGKQIAFIAYVHGSPEVYVMNDKGKKLQRLTTDSAADADPVWSPDGARVLFTSDRGGVPWLYTVRADGSALSRLPLSNRITGAHQADWSHDGRIIFSLWGQAPATPAKMSADAHAPATLVYSPTPTPTAPEMAVMSAPEAVTGYNRIISYEYDSLYRLTGATYTEGATVNEYAYGYDLRGNRTSVTAPEVGTFSYTYNLANQINYPDFTYDPNGNLTGDGYATYTYDAANRLRGVVTGVDATTYQYDGFGNRIGLTHNGVETAYLLDPSGALSQVLRETTGGVNTLYLHGLGIIGQQQGSTWTTLGYDPLGSVRFVLDSSGTLTHALNYDPYGVPLQPNTATTLGFTGEQTDPNDLLYLRARYYHPKLGAFTSVDPVLGVGGSTGWNGYLYANANPANLTDPSGACIGPLTFLLPACIAAGKLLIGGLAGATIVGGAAFVNDVRGQVWYNQTQAGMSFLDSFQHLNVAGLIDSTLKGAEFGFNLGTGFGAGALAQKFGFAGAKAIAAGLASDVILGASWDIAAHGDNFFTAVAGNTLGFLGGEFAGEVLQRGFRLAQRGLSAADDLLLRIGRWYNNTFDLGAVTAGGFPVLRRPNRPTLSQIRALKNMGLDRIDRRFFLEGEAIYYQMPTRGGDPIEAMIHLRGSRLESAIFSIKDLSGGGAEEFGHWRELSRRTARALGVDELQLTGIAVINPRLELMFRRLSFTPELRPIPRELNVGEGFVEVWTKIFPMR
ncbi:MAG: PD40 domain-containing protein, partial [Anaerolineae bacterium]|nr:PD40 domain-containing protein [Anaerolineae bacterium]